MINWINRVTEKYGRLIIISFGIVFILIGFILQLKNIEAFNNYNPKSRFNSEIRSINKTPTNISYILGVGLILLGIKKDWIFKKKKSSKIKEAKILKFKPLKDKR